MRRMKLIEGLLGGGVEGQGVRKKKTNLLMGGGQKIY